MSRTDKTSPTPVKIANDRRIEIHDHVNGVCELEADPNRLRVYGGPPHQCYLDGDWYEPHHRCSCWSCKGGSWLMKEKTRAKTNEKKALRHWDEEYR